MPALTKTVPMGAAPRSVAEHDGLVFVLATGDARIDTLPAGGLPLVPIEGSSTGSCRRLTARRSASRPTGGR